MKTSNLAQGQINGHARKNGVAAPRFNERTITVSMPSQLVDELDADARSKRMSRNAFLRAMIRGYFGSACRP